MEHIKNETDLKNPPLELIKKMTKYFSFINFYKLEDYKAGIVITPEQAIVILIPEIIKQNDGKESLHVYHRDLFKSIYRIIGEQECTFNNISPLNISCLSTEYANFCFVEYAKANSHTITQKMMKVVDKIMKLIWAYPKEVQYCDMRAKGIITVNDSDFSQYSTNNNQQIIGIPIDDFIKSLDKQLATKEQLIESFDSKEPNDRDER